MRLFSLLLMEDEDFHQCRSVSRNREGRIAIEGGAKLRTRREESTNYSYCEIRKEINIRKYLSGVYLFYFIINSYPHAMHYLYADTNDMT
jgi:hypothetical protein